MRTSSYTVLINMSSPSFVVPKSSKSTNTLIFGLDEEAVLSPATNQLIYQAQDPMEAIDPGDYKCTKES